MTSTFTLSTTASDQWGDANGDYSATGTELYLNHDSGVGDAHLADTWIPFTVPLPQGKQIISATLKWVASASRSDAIDCDIGCEDADNPSAPANAGDLRGRVMTTAKLNITPGAYTAGVQYSYVITTSVQEVLDRPGWASGNTMAVKVEGNSTGANDYRRLIAANENVTYTEPQLVIVVDDYIPQASFLF